MAIYHLSTAVIMDTIPLDNVHRSESVKTYYEYVSSMKKSSPLISIMALISTLAALLTYTAFANYHDYAIFAQTTNNATNQTAAQVTGQPETTILNKTTIPAQQTNVTVNQTTEPVSPQALQPLENLTQQQPANLSAIENKTMITPTGNATTTLVNKTTVPFNQTMVTGGSNQTQQQNQTGVGVQGGQQQQNQTQQQQNQQNNTNPLSKVPILGELFK